MPDTAAWIETSANHSADQIDQPTSPAELWIGERSLFMRNMLSCPACRLQQTATGRNGVERLHVRVTDTYMVVTVADDLHQPGRSVYCERMLSFPGGLMFRLTQAPPKAASRDAEALAGMAFLSRHNRRWHLKVFGHAEGVTSTHDCLFDAVEEI